MKPGETKIFQRGSKRAIVLAIGVWANQRKKDGPIHIHITGTPKFHTTVTNRPGNRYHRTLFRDLRRVLMAQNRWPYGNEGAETEQRGG
jgi:hypothetical protein